MTALRSALVVALVIGVAGGAGRLTDWPTITSTLGPTAYLFVAHPGSATARWPTAIVGHGAAIVVGLITLLIFGLWSSPSQSLVGFPSWAQVGAGALAVGLTLLVLDLIRSHHAPAAATSLLIATGLAAPGRGFDGLLVGLGVVLGLTPTLDRLAPGRPPDAGG